jgi:hypothetical protein
MTRPDWAADFLEALRRSGDVQLAAGCAGVERSTAYRRRHRCEAFAAEWDRALDLHHQAATRSARQRLAQITQQTQHGEATHWQAWRPRDRPADP